MRLMDANASREHFLHNAHVGGDEGVRKVPVHCCRMVEWKRCCRKGSKNMAGMSVVAISWSMWFRRDGGAAHTRSHSLIPCSRHYIKLRSMQSFGRHGCLPGALDFGFGFWFFPRSTFGGLRLRLALDLVRSALLPLLDGRGPFLDKAHRISSFASD